MSDAVPRIRIPRYDSQEASVVRAIRSGQLTQGPHLVELAEKLCSLFGRKFAVLTNNGFAALFASLKALDLPVGTTVATAVASTCFSIVNAIRAAGHVVEYVDLESSSLSMMSMGRGGRSGSVAIVPDHFGRIAELTLSGDLAGHRYIEDAAQSFISRTRVATAAPLLVVSFYPTKLMNGIDGGAVLTDDIDVYNRLRQLISYADQDRAEETVRYNLGMNNLCAAFALGTVEHLHEMERQLESNFDILAGVAEAHGLTVVRPSPGEVPSRLVVKCRSEEERDSVITVLQQRGVSASRELLWLCPQHEVGNFPAAAELVGRTCSLPFFPDLSSREITAIDQALEAIS